MTIMNFQEHFNAIVYDEGRGFQSNQANEESLNESIVDIENDFPPLAGFHIWEGFSYCRVGKIP